MAGEEFSRLMQLVLAYQNENLTPKRRSKAAEFLLMKQEDMEEKIASKETI